MKLALALVTLVTLAACGAGAPSASSQFALGEYQGQQDMCTLSADTRAHDDACRDRVKTYWCGPQGQLAEAGACSTVTLSDGGKP